MKSYTIRKTDTNLYIKGFSGPLVFLALYGVAATLFLFVVLYLTAGPFTAAGLCVPAFFTWLYMLSRIQKKYGHRGWSKKRLSRQLPHFITIRQRINQY